MRGIYPDESPGLSWIMLALLLHIALFFSTRFWPRDEINPRVEESIQVSLLAMDAQESSEPPAPLPPAPPPPEPPQPKPVVTPRPVAPKPVMPEAEIPTPIREAPQEAPTMPAISAAAPESTAPASDAPAANNQAPNASAGAASSALVGAIFDAAYLHNPKPPYPARSKQLREEGTVRLRVHVLPDGHADQVEIRHGSGFSRLDDAARMTVLRWRFIPGRRGGEAVASWVIVPIHFNLEESFP